MLFRYPGGKGKMASVILQHCPNNITDYAEPFVGGGSVALAIAKKFPHCTIALNDADYWIASFWQVLCGDEPSFKKLLILVNHKPTISEFEQRRETFQPHNFEKRRLLSPNIVDAAYNALFFNRTTFSGILSSGPIGGAEQSEPTFELFINTPEPLSVASRWPASLADDLITARILLKNRTYCDCGDFEEFILRHPNSFLYLDPPYMKAGAALYGQSKDDTLHLRLKRLLNERTNWLLSYDPEGHTLYNDFPYLKLSHFRSMSGGKGGKKERPHDESEVLIKPKDSQ